MNALIVKTVNYSGHRFSDFYAVRDPSTGPGWYVYGRNAEKFGRLPDGEGAYVSLCIRPNVKARRHPHYNVSVQRGFRTLREAARVAAAFNAEVL